MAEATALRNNALPYPVYGAPYTVAFPILDADGDLVTGAASLDSEVSKNGDTFADCTNEATEIATSSGVYYLTLTATEMTADIVSVIVKTSTSGAKTTTLVLYPRKLVTLASGTSQGGAAGYITLAAGTVLFNNQFSGCLCVATIDTVVEARILGTCTASNQQCAVAPDWVSGDPGPDSNDTYVIYLPEGMRIPETNVRAISDDATAADNCELMFDGTGYAGGTARLKVDVDTLKTQAITCAAGVTIRADVGAAAAPGSVNGMLIGGSNAATTFAMLTSTGAFTCGSMAVSGALSVGTTTTLTGVVTATAANDIRGITVTDYASGKAPLQPTTAGRTLDVTATGEAGIDWANIGSPTTTVNLSGTSTKANETAPPTVQNIVDGISTTVPSGKTNAFGSRIPDAVAGAASGLAIVGSAMGLANASIVTATFGTCVPPAPSGMSTLTQTQVTGGAWDVTHWFGAKGGLPILDASTGLILQGYGAGGVTVGTVTTLTNAPSDSSGVAALLLRIPQIIAMAQVGGTGAYYVEALTNSGAAIHASGAAVAKSPATLDWSADVTNKPTIGTSTLSAADVWGYATRVLTANTNLGLPASWPASWPANWNWSTIAIGDITSTGGKIVLNGSGYVTYANTAPPSAASIADSVWDETLADHAATGSTGKALSSASAAGDPWGTAVPGAYGAGTAGYVLGTNLNITVSSRGTGTALDAAGVRSALGMSTADLDTQLDAILAASTPAGGSCTQTVTVTSGGVAVPNASVEILSGSVLIDRQTTNDSGVATPSANAGTYTLRVTCTGYASSTTTITVTAAAARAVTLTAISVTASDPGFTTLYGRCYKKSSNSANVPSSGVTVNLQMAATASVDTGHSFEGATVTTTSDANGDYEFLNCVQGAVYHVWRGAGTAKTGSEVKTMRVGTEATQKIPSFIGND